MKKILLILFLVSFNTTFSEIQAQNDFDEVDDFARRTRKSTNYLKTAEKLVAPFESEAEKARSIFIWITDHVKYDIKKAKNRNGKPKRTKIFADSEEELEQIKKKRHIEKANIAFRSGKGVCENYAYLFHFMSEHVGLESAFISGHGRNNPRSINKFPRGSNHAWNGIKIDGNWYLLDATWAAGMSDTGSGKFTKIYQEGFFMTKPEYFLTTHFPDDPDWQLVNTPISKEQFSQLPLGHHAFGASGIKDYFPKSGVLKNGKEGITLTLLMDNPDIQYFLLDNRQRTKIQPMINGNEIRFNIDKKRMSGHELTIAKKLNGTTVPIISYIVI